MRPRATTTATKAAGICALLMMLSLGAAWADGVTPSNTWDDLYSSHCTMAGLPVPVGSAIAVFDPQGTRCGEQVVTIAGHIAPVMPCYGDDAFTPVDEGPVQGEALHFTLNNRPVVPQAVTRNFVPVPPDTPVTWGNQYLWEINLVMPPQPLATVRLVSSHLRLDWASAGTDVTAYEIWQSRAPYFAPGEPGSVLVDVVGLAGPLTWSTGVGVGDTAVNYTYRLRSVNGPGQTLGFSQAVADFDIPLYR